MNIWEKLVRCETPGELQRMIRGTNFELVENGEIARLYLVDENAKELQAEIEKLHEVLKKANYEIAQLSEVVSKSPKKWSFHTLMWAANRILAEHYPQHIVTGVSGDPGPRLIVALRDCLSITSEGPKEGDPAF